MFSRKKNANLLYDFSSGGDLARVKATYSPQKLYLFIFSLLFSSALSGMVLYATFMFEAYKIVGLEMEQQAIERLNGEITKIDERLLGLSKTIPRAVLVLGGTVVLGWFISFVATLARHWSFQVTRTDKQFLIKSGVLIKRRHIINKDKINYYDLRQTLLMKLFKICSVTLDCTGYGKSRREISALIPVTTYEQMNASLTMLVPELPRPKPEVKTGIKDIRRFVTIPMVFCVLPPVITHYARYFLPERSKEINAIAAVMMIPLVWLVLVKAAAALNTSVGFSENGCSINYCRFYMFHRLFLPKSNISKIRITRNPWQLVNKTCTLWIYTSGETEKYHKMKYMPYRDICKICLREGYVMFE